MCIRDREEREGVKGFHFNPDLKSLEVRNFQVHSPCRVAPLSLKIGKSEAVLCQELSTPFIHPGDVPALSLNNTIVLKSLKVPYLAMKAK